jgi:hypothetical protein
MQMTPATLLHERKVAETDGLIGRAGFKCLSPFQLYHYTTGAAAMKGRRVKKQFLIN